MLTVNALPSDGTITISIWPSKIGLMPTFFWQSKCRIASTKSISGALHIRNDYASSIKVTLIGFGTITTDSSIYSLGTGTNFWGNMQFQLLATKVSNQWLLPIGNGTYQIEFICYDENNEANEVSTIVTLKVSGINKIGTTSSITYILMSYYLFFLMIGGFITMLVVLSFVYSSQIEIKSR